MTIIDQRILIPSGPEVIWEMVGDISQNPNWQTDCTNISFLTSRRSGQGVRWRYTSSSGHDYVLETTAWYDGLGYEYTYIDGANYRESKGRLRLQEIPEGTIVQWTFSYELPGVIGSLRNSMGAKRALEAVMVESLKNLWRKVNENRDQAYVHEAKSLIREAIDYEGRQRYRSRHPSAEGDTQDRHERFKPSAPPPVLREPAAPTRVVIPEPPLDEEDTRPNQAVAAPEVPQPSATPAPEPDFLANLPPVSDKPAAPAADPPIPQAEPPVPAAPLAPAEKPPAAVDDPKPAASTPSPAEGDSSRFRPPPVPFLDEPAPAADSPPPADVPHTTRETSEQQAEPPVETAEAASETLEEPQHSTRESAKLDTSEMSIWEIFGVPRPSETQEIAAVKIEEALKDGEPPVIVPEEQPAEAVAAPEAVATPEAEASEVLAVTPSSAAAPVSSPATVFIGGLRLRHRRKLVRLRRRYP